MTISEILDYIHKHPEKPEGYLDRDRTGTGFVCPICGSGSGKKGTGITSRDGNIHFKCWVGCFESADIIDIIGMKHGIPETDFIGRVKKAAEIYHLPLDENPTHTHTHTYTHNPQTYTHTHTHKPTMNTGKDPVVETKADYTAFYAEANKALADTDYWQNRGLSKDLLDRFNVGYCKDWRHPKNPTGSPTPRLIIPTSKSSYVARHTGENVPDDQRYKKVSSALFNGAALFNSDKPVFITEGEIDALSILEVGEVAVGLGSKSYQNILIQALLEKPPTQPLILALDKDDRGLAGNQELAEKLKQLGVIYTIETENIYIDCKDANEALMKDRDGFKAALQAAVSRAELNKAEAADTKLEELRREAVAYSLEGFKQRVKESALSTKYSTYYEKLDEALGGGLYAGLYIVGAVSSLGKTTFCMQLADNLAAQGYDVLVFSLEMSRDELIAKSLSRLSYIYSVARNAGDLKEAKTTRNILNGSYQNDTAQDSYQDGEPVENLIDRAIGEYREYGTRLYITEGIGDVGVKDVREKVQRYYSIVGKAPVVIIDYLQILAPQDVRATDKQNTDRAVLELKRLSRDFKIPVIGISSFNRENYTNPVNLASFKESGAIEYSSDVLIGLQYAGMDYLEGDGKGDSSTRVTRIRKLREQMDKAAKEGSKGATQRIQLKILKSRNGSRGDVYFRYVPMFNHFSEDPNQEPEKA